MDKSLKLHSDLAEDVATSSSFRQFKIKHFHLDLSVDFEKRTLRGTETLQLKCIQDSQSELLLDIHPSLSMQEVSYCRSEDDSDSVKVEFMTRNFTSYGTTLVVKFPAPCKIEEQFRVVVKFLASDGPGVSECHSAVVTRVSLPSNNNTSLLLPDDWLLRMYFYLNLYRRKI